MDGMGYEAFSRHKLYRAYMLFFVLISKAIVNLEARYEKSAICNHLQPILDYLGNYMINRPLAIQTWHLGRMSWKCKDFTPQFGRKKCHRCG